MPNDNKKGKFWSEFEREGSRIVIEKPSGTFDMKVESLGSRLGTIVLLSCAIGQAIGIAKKEKGDEQSIRLFQLATDLIMEESGKDPETDYIRISKEDIEE